MTPGCCWGRLIFPLWPKIGAHLGQDEQDGGSNTNCQAKLTKNPGPISGRIGKAGAGQDFKSAG